MSKNCVKLSEQKALRKERKKEKTQKEKYLLGGVKFRKTIK